MTTGVVTSVSPHNGSGTLTTDVAIGATVLPLDDAEPFAEDFTEPRYLVIGSEGTPREYVATVNDESGQESVTLAVPLDVDVELGLPVTPWDPTVVADDKRGVTHAVWVRLDGQDGTIRATVPHELIPLSGVDALIGASVGLDEDPMTGWMVEQVFGREATLDQSYLHIPLTRAHLGSAQSVPDGSYTTIVDLGQVGVDVHPDFTLSPGDGTLTLHEPGAYLCQASVRFANNTSGNRRIRFMASFGDIVDRPMAEVIVEPADDGAVQPQVSMLWRFPENSTLKLQAYQTSGASLNVTAANEWATYMSVIRLAV